MLYQTSQYLVILVPMIRFGNTLSSIDVPIHRFRSVSATDPVVLTNIELTDIGSVN